MTGNDPDIARVKSDLLVSAQSVQRTAGSGVRLAEIVGALALATDLGLGQPLEHVLRSCVIASRFASHIGASREDTEAAYWVTLFMTAGCTGASFELSKVFGDDIAFRAGIFNVGPSTLDQLRYVLGRAGSNRGPLGRLTVRAGLLATRMSSIEQSFIAHCAVSARLAERLGLDERVVASLWQTFARWDGKGLPKGLRGDDLLLPVRIANLANLVEAREREHGVVASCSAAREFSGTLFDPALVGAWCDAAPSLVIGVDAESSWDRVMNGQPPGRGLLSEDELDDALELLADYADLKSPFFTGHSRGVASLAVAAAHQAGLPRGDRVLLNRAALVHDIGRNGVPNSIWDKPEPLTTGEYERVRLHAYYTDRVLQRAGGLAALAVVASAAHERAAGGGYPRGTAGASIPMLGRLLAAADAYHAMLEERPHRQALSREQARTELRQAAQAGEFDGVATDAVLAAAGHRVRRRPTAPGGLTPREIEVLVLAARGATTKAVAASLSISPKTAGNHIESIYMKVGISTRVEAAMFAMQHGLLVDWDTAQT